MSRSYKKHYQHYDIINNNHKYRSKYKKAMNRHFRRALNQGRYDDEVITNNYSYNKKINNLANEAFIKKYYSINEMLNSLKFTYSLYRNNNFNKNIPHVFYEVDINNLNVIKSHRTLLTLPLFLEDNFSEYFDDTINDYQKEMINK